MARLSRAFAQKESRSRVATPKATKNKASHNHLVTLRGTLSNLNLDFAEFQANSPPIWD